MLENSSRKIGVRKNTFGKEKKKLVLGNYRKIGDTKSTFGKEREIKTCAWEQ